MGIPSKHSYRFVYLKSEEWKDVRIEALARDGAKCQLCGFESVSNDAHHIHYPKSFWDTKSDDLIILCRPCHNFIHDLEKCGVVNFKGEKANCVSGIQAIIKAISTWRGFITNPQPQTIPKTSVLAERSRAVDVNDLICCGCKLPKGSCKRRQIVFTTVRPEHMAYRFCDGCFYIFNQNIPKGIQALSNKKKSHHVVRLIVKSLVDSGKIQRPGYEERKLEKRLARMFPSKP